MRKIPLPIDALLPQIVGHVQHNTISIIQAEPGAGKTTRVPPALVDAFPGITYVLEPRRLATRLAAKRVAEELSQRVGETVGYQVRFEQSGGPQTRLWYVTEGVLTRKLLSDRHLKNASVVVLDEFHERHLDTDVVLAVLRNLQQARADLRIVLMSATLDADKLSEQLGGAAVIRAPGRVFPIEIRYKPESAESLDQQVASAVSEAGRLTNGHILAFLPGAAEIRHAMQACEPVARALGAKLLPLHGDLPVNQQDEAIAPSTTRKIICSTNVTESSITIDGVEAVVDSGLARVLVHSAWSGLSRLEVQKIPQSSAIQRAGRAGRTQPGLAIRLYSESDFVRRPKDLAPEILRSDFAGVLLQLSAAGLDWRKLPWLEPPPSELAGNATALLRRLGALDRTCAVTEMGRRMAGLPLHPRLARFVLEASELGSRRDACEVAGRLSSGRLRLASETTSRYASDLDQILASDLEYMGRRLRDQLLQSTASVPVKAKDAHALEKGLLVGYSDRVGRRRGDILLLCDGSSARFHGDSLAARHSLFLVAIEVEERSQEGLPVVRLASVIEPDWLLEYFPDRIDTREELTWNRDAERVEQASTLQYEKVAIDETRSAPRHPAAAALLAEKVLEAGIERLAEAEELNRFLRRVRFAQQHAMELNIPTDLVESGLRQLAAGLTSFRELREAARDGGLLSILRAGLPMRLIDEVAPTHVLLPSGRRARVDYHDAQPPSVASRLQDFFGMNETPSVAHGSVPLVVQLLAPNHRPVQVTTDLPSFWKNLYPQLRRELGRRYPKHAWPEDPRSVLRG